MRHIKQRKLIESLTALDEEEFKLLGKWLKSTWHNPNKKLLSLYKLIRPYYPKFAHPSLKVELLYAKLFPNKEWDNKSFNNLLGKFKQQIERFTIDQYIQHRPELQKELLRKDNLERQLNKKFRYSSQQLIKQYSSILVPEEEDLWQLSQLNDQLYFEPSDEKRYEPNPNHLEQANHYLDQLYLIRKYRYLYESTQRNSILQSKQTNDFQVSLLRELAQKLNNTTANLYQICIDQAHKNDRDQVEAFRQKYFECYDQLAPRAQKIFFIFCTNNAVKLSTQGDLQGYRDLLELYQFGLRKGILLYKGQITGTTYNNFVLVGTLLNKEQIVIQFIQQYAPSLPKEIFEDATNWSTAQLMYSQGLYNNCIVHITQRKFVNKVYEIQSKVSLTKAYFDLQRKDRSYYNTFISHCKAFEKYIQRSKLYGLERKKACLKWIRYTKSLTKINSATDRQQQLNQIIQRLTDDTNVFGLLWLFQKIEELRRREDDLPTNEDRP